MESPANRAAAGSASSRSSTWETRRVRVSFNASSDSSQLTARHDPGAGVAGSSTSAGRSRASRSGTSSSSPALPVSTLAGQLAQSRRAVRGRSGVAPGRGRRDAGDRLGMAQQPPEAFFGEDLGHAGPVQRRALDTQRGGDLVGGQALSAQLDHPAPGPVFGRRYPGRRAGLARRREQFEAPGTVLADQVHHRPPGVAEPSPGLGVGQPVEVERPQRLVAALVHLLRRGEPPRIALW